jgi:hypothetical protein
MPQSCAKHLANNMWTLHPDATTDLPPDLRETCLEDHDLDIIIMEELIRVIKKFKRHRAPGPDEIPMECPKELDEFNFQSILDLLNEWWRSVPTDTLRARAVLIHKRGNTSNMDNYRLISLLNTP